MFRIVFALLFAGSILVTGVLADEKEKDTATVPTADEIIAKFIEASGGAEAIQKISTRVSESRMEFPAQGFSGSLKVHQKTPAYFLAEVVIPDIMNAKEGTTGKIAWEIAQTGPRLKTAKETAQAFRSSDLHFALRIKQLYKQVESKGTEKFQGKDCLRIDCTPPEEGGSVDHYFFDPETHLLHGSRQKLITAMGPMKVETLSSDYKEVDGLQVAFTIEQNFVDMGVQMKIVTTKVEHNVKIDDSKFQLPESIQKLIEARKKPTTQAKTPTPTPKPKKEEGGW